MSRDSEPPSFIPSIQRQLHVSMIYSVEGPKGLAEVSCVAPGGLRFFGSSVLMFGKTGFEGLEIVPVAGVGGGVGRGGGEARA